MPASQQTYDSYKQALTDHEAKRASENTAWTTLQQKEAALAQALQERDAAQSSYNAAQAALDQALSATQNAHTAVR